MTHLGSRVRLVYYRAYCGKVTQEGIGTALLYQNTPKTGTVEYLTERSEADHSPVAWVRWDEPFRHWWQSKDGTCYLLSEECITPCDLTTIEVWNIVA